MDKKTWEKLIQSQKLIDAEIEKEKRRGGGFWTEIPSNTFPGNRGYSPISVSRELLAKQNPIQSPKATQFDLSSDEIQGIIQKSQKGFQIIDIQPNVLSRTENFCVLTDDRLIELIGSQNEGAGSGATVDNQTSTYSTAPYWRSVQLPLQGNYLKIEYLPTIAQGVDCYYAPANNIQNAYYDAQNCDSTFQIQDAHRYAGSRMVLLNFEDVNQKPIIVEDGQEFFGYFTNVILTFKQLSPRIRVTVGFNTSIRNSKDNKPTNLHLWGTSGILDKNQLNPIPFCISEKDISSYSDGNGIEVQNGVTNPVEENLIWTNNNSYSGSNKYPNGVGVFWITDLDFSVWQSNPSITDSTVEYWDLELFIYDIGSASLIKRLACRTCGISQWYNAGFGSIGVNYIKDNVSIKEPIRVVLKPNQALRMRLTSAFLNGGSTIRRGKFSMSGYSIGRLIGAGASGLNTPFNLNLKLTDNPYNSDFDYQYQPRT